MAVMRQLVTPSAHFFLVARSKDKLTAVAQDLLVRGALRVDMIVTDLDDVQAHPQMLAVATSQLGTIDLALLAHGVLGDQAAAERDYPVAEHVLVTNFLSAVSLLTWLANYCESQGRGSLAVISSVAGDRGRKSNYVYGASKAGLDAFLSGLRNRCSYGPARPSLRFASRSAIAGRSSAKKNSVVGMVTASATSRPRMSAMRAFMNVVRPSAPTVHMPTVADSTIRSARRSASRRPRSASLRSVRSRTKEMHSPVSRSKVAVVRMFVGSEPALGSVIAIAIVPQPSANISAAQA